MRIIFRRDMPPTKSPKEAIKEHMKEQGIEQYLDLAHRIGISHSNLSMILSKKITKISAK